MIYTFYSYKGGAGRTMALANVAEFLYRAGRNVLMVDWDLEAPGLEHYFPSTASEEIRSHAGVIDMLLDYKRQMAKDMVGDASLDLGSPAHYLMDIYPVHSGSGRLSMLTAGRRSSAHFAEYAQAVLTFNWKDFYETWGGELYFDWLREQLQSIAEVVLIDSRTGVTEISGVCTYQLADMVVILCAPGRQTLDGTYRVAQSLRTPEVQDLRHGRPLEVLIIPARVERAESELLDQFHREFISQFEAFVPGRPGLDVHKLWQLGIPYVPKYAFTEAVATRESGLASAEDMVIVFRRLVEAMGISMPKVEPLSDALDKIDAELQEIAMTDPAKRIQKVEDFRSIRQWLDDLSHEHSPTSSRRIENLRTRYYRLAQPIADELQKRCDRQLQAYEASRASSNTEHSRQKLIEVSRLYDQIVGLLADRGSDPKTTALGTRLDALRAEVGALERLQSLRNEIMQLWSRAKRLEEAEYHDSVGQAVDHNREAVRILEGELHSDSWPSATRDELIMLLGEARIRYDDIRNRHEIPATKQAGSELVSLIADLAERASRNPSELVTYFVSAEPMANIQPMPVTAALAIAKSRLVHWWRDKLDQYIEEAYALLSARRPHEAMAALNSWRSLPGLDDPRIGVWLPDDLAMRTQQAEQAILPYLEAWNNAEAMAARAYTEPDPLRAYDLLERAMAICPYLSAIEPLRESVDDRLHEEVKFLLGEADKWCRVEAWNLCESRLDRANQLLEVSVRVRHELQHEYDQLRSICNQQTHSEVGSGESDHIDVLNLALNGQRIMLDQGLIVELSALEMKLLGCLYEHAGTVVRREMLMERVFEQSRYDPRDKRQLSRLNSLVHRLRSRIKAAGGPASHIVTVRGVGYKLSIDPTSDTR